MPTVDDVIVNSGKMEEDGGSWDLRTTRVELDGHSSGMMRMASLKPRTQNCKPRTTKRCC
ncbi:unnamed protein product [Clonostachys chloroleuca]|uniref:Uncharacterized protein n=1 Tax=Clonostachys chloroleuca TaxID=1926264 RepID=A0AA35M684_9HYPO|nr:unnamed protein product [Clonostachys chloroleuca]